MCVFVKNQNFFAVILLFSVNFMDLRGIFKSCSTIRKAHQPEIAKLNPLDWSKFAEAQPTPGLPVSEESMRAAEEVVRDTRQLQED